ncbi:hypothetical protein GJ744_010987 [Endocarpon pusillum]|uniref:NAD(P)-binding domain-containing protein n=1 Tax=Endocarpon pusillum TaxID=364733 RepID=A0A8H7AFD4_9EURO|nr:hypothetical protein GJ744_010987 [Endocarpon pusillum]
MSSARSIIIVGVGPFISTSLARRLAVEGWNIALLSRSENSLRALAEELNKQKAENAKIVVKAVDAGDAGALLQALEASKKELGSVDVVCYNAARVGYDDLMTVKHEVLEADFKVSAVGTLVTGQWFAENANTSKVGDGEYPLLLVTGGLLHQHPMPSMASLSAVKSASQSIATNFSQVLPEKYQVQVGQPLIEQAIIPDGKGGYQTKSDPDVIVDKIFMPYFEDRMKVGQLKEWKLERVH